ncbi:alpha/beta fold hydrolase [Rhodococcus ruber]|uniref:Putative hydrolase n=1 Tax=Rhodococcus ruber TaxID=1830 RepID=A0A098BGK9_9NOCA|nr:MULTISPECIES: alpha/beta fold hydrolase [Rhodococcus]MCD2129757.1 alpha/beta fold hydrolase [Rhodococcus ruber]MCZ1072782.1 alpha/beta fold hydrolase [Rhodococcus sp. A5(2022)]MCZ4504783.1 alpha/beta fold hydrolase [Rhodococcus ruber]MCZ4532338.1 alpha/beta fold hydrolase [Rhodococcus ruber]MCZ4622815.1 alpha/beta fold hydrolase [Rhodococcus ruber]
MPRASTTGFATTTEGERFLRAYDAVLAKWPADVRPVTVESDFGTTHVNVCGSDDAPPVVLLPGGGATSTVWFANAAALAGRYRVLAVDPIGDVGRSVAHGRPVRDVDDLRSWLDGVAAALGLSSFHLAGHSYGAMVALAYALERPERIRNMVLLDPNSCFARMRAGYLARAVPLLLRPSGDRQRRFLRWETGGRSLDEDWLELVALGAEHFPAGKLVVPKRPARRALAGLAVDTTVVLAAGSKVHDSATVAATVEAASPRLRPVLVEGATHHTMPMVPAAEVNAAVLGALG